MPDISLEKVITVGDAVNLVASRLHNLGSFEESLKRRTTVSRGSSKFQASCAESVPAREAVAQTMKRIMTERLGVGETRVTERASLMDNLGADSLDMVELVMAGEEEFGIEIYQTQLPKKIITVEDAVNAIMEQLA